MMTCQSCGGIIGRDCFNPEECMAITRDMAERYQQQHDAAGRLDQCEAALDQCRAEIQCLNERIAEMNDVFGEIRRTVATVPFDPTPIEEPDIDGPWLPVGLLQKIDAVMEQEHRL
jgi:chromosome segregation ATPase